MRRPLATLLLVLAPALAAADAEPYSLDIPNSIVGFAYTLAGQDARGTMPVAAARILLDLDRPQMSEVSATLDPTRAEAGLFLATQAMRGPSVLDTDHHPRIEFRSTRVIPTGETARVEGLLTVRGETRPVTLEARIYRQKGTDAGDRDKLSIHLTGTIHRSDFGASGYPDLVGEDIALDILTRIDRQR